MEREVEVGKGLIISYEEDVPKLIGRQKIDIIWKKKGETFVIEAKERLSPEAIGQAIVYKELYKKENLGENVKSGILCKFADEELLQIVEKYVDEIFILE